MRSRLKAALLGVSSVILAVVSLLFVLGFPPFIRPERVTVYQLIAEPNSWLGKRVSVEGKIWSVMFIPEEVGPYNYVVGPPNARFGVVWKNADPLLLDQNVQVVGIVKYGSAEPGNPFFKFDYYIEAEGVTRIDIHAR